MTCSFLVFNVELIMLDSVSSFSNQRLDYKISINPEYGVIPGLLYHIYKLL